MRGCWIRDGNECGEVSRYICVSERERGAWEYS